MALKNGAKGAHGGPRPGSGRPPDWLKKKCSEMIDKHKLVDMLADIALNGENESVKLRAIEMLMDRGFGKPAQAMELSGTVDVPIRINVIKSYVQ
jgi:hypothetical protein